MGKQSLSLDAPDIVQHFKHNLSLASSSKSDKQRRDALAYLKSQLSQYPPVNPVGTRALLTKLMPLISDSSTPVRDQLREVLSTLQQEEVRYSVDHVILFVRAGMTHLSTDISRDALYAMEWLLKVAPTETVACAGGWVKTLSTFCAVLGWSTGSSKAGWSSGSRSGMRASDEHTKCQQLTILRAFLKAGLGCETEAPHSSSEVWDNLYRIPRGVNAFEYLNLTGTRRDEEGEIYSSREARQQIFHRRFWDPIIKGVEQARKQGGSVGRATMDLSVVLKEGMGDYEFASAIDNQDLLDLW